MTFLLYKPKQILNYQRKVCVLFFILFQFVMNLNKEAFPCKGKQGPLSGQTHHFLYTNKADEHSV